MHRKAESNENRVTIKTIYNKTVNWNFSEIDIILSSEGKVTRCFQVIYLEKKPDYIPWLQLFYLI